MGQTTEIDQRHMLQINLGLGVSLDLEQAHCFIWLARLGNSFNRPGT